MPDSSKSGRLRERESEDEFTGRDLGQELLLLGVRAGLEDRDGAAEDGGHVRARDERAAEFLHEDHLVDEVEASAAVLFRNQQAVPALLRHLLPEDGGVTLFVLFHFPDVRLRALVLQELAGGVLQEFLLFIQSQVHSASLPIASSETAGTRAALSVRPR